MKQIIVVGGATGDLDQRIVNALLERGAEVRVAVRTNSSNEKISEFEKHGVKVFKLNSWSVDEFSKA